MPAIATFQPERLPAVNQCYRDQLNNQARQPPYHCRLRSQWQGLPLSHQPKHTPCHFGGYRYFWRCPNVTSKSVFIVQVYVVIV